MARLKRSVTIDDVMSFCPCLRHGEVAVLFNGKKRMTLAELKLVPVDALSYQSRAWLLLREEFLPVKTLHLLACSFAERALRRERKDGREPDKRSWDAICVKRRWVAGKATDEELAAAGAAAWAAARAAAGAAARDADSAAAWAAAWAAAGAAAWDAAGAAARAAAWGAAWGAAWDAENRWQYHKILRAMLSH